MTYQAHIKNGVAVLDDAVRLPDGTQVRVEVERVGSDFWQNKSADELAKEQGVKRIRNLEKLAGDWPPEDSVDEFIELVRKARQ